MIRRKAERTKIADNFFAHCDLSAGPDGCWPFQRSKNKLGYGRVWVNGKCEEAHRYAYTLVKGQIPSDLLVLHGCDFPSCCNPAHLRVGTRVDNARDKEERDPGHQPRGENNAMSKLTTRQVIFIKRCRDLFNTYEMAAMLGVQNSTVSKVLRGEQWRHVPDVIRYLPHQSTADRPFGLPDDDAGATAKRQPAEA